MHVTLARHSFTPRSSSSAVNNNAGTSSGTLPATSYSVTIYCASLAPLKTENTS